MLGSRKFFATAFPAILGLGLLSCGGDSGGSGSETINPPPCEEPDCGEPIVEIELVVASPDRCANTDQRHCLLPFPNDTFTVEDETMDSGKRLNLVRESMMQNAAGVYVETEFINGNDGWSPGAAAVAHIPGLDLDASEIPPLTDLARSLDSDATTILLDATTGKRIPHWGELDQNVENEEDRLFFIRPAVNLPYGHRIIVAIRALVDTSGAPIGAGDVFRAYRDGLISDVTEVEAQRARYEGIFADLQEAGVAREELYLAWDFTVASVRNMTERLLHIRDDSFADLGDAAPQFAVDEVEEPLDDKTLRRINGTFEVPHYLTKDGLTGGQFVFGENGLPERQGTYTASFRCIVPRAAFAENGAAIPARPSLYGHGLLGSEREVSAGNVRDMANEHNFVFCATRWLGMAEEDVPTAIALLQDLSNMNVHADRLQQGVLAYLYLGRLLIHQDGFGSDPAFQGLGESVIDTSELYYDGNSQGGIMGGVLTAVAQDFTKAVLGVTGMNYSLLLQRSVDWDAYRSIYEPSYEKPLEAALGILIMQLLWDRGEANAYAAHMTDDPLPNTPAHKVLMHVAFGDHQVTPTSAEIKARTVGAKIHRPIVTVGRLPAVEPGWGIDSIPAYPYEGSAIVFWDSGSPTPPMTNVPPRDGRDPHGDPRNDVDVRRQKASFLSPASIVINVCPEGPCLSSPG